MKEHTHTRVTSLNDSPTKEQIKEERRKLNNKELHNFYPSLITSRVTKM